MSKTLRTESGAPVADNQNSQTAGPRGPVLLQDQHLLEKLARFNRERIPERIVHAVGSGAYGHFEVTNPDVSRWTRMRMMSEAGKRTPRLRALLDRGRLEGRARRRARSARLRAQVLHRGRQLGSRRATTRPIFFIRDPLKFPDFIH